MFSLYKKSEISFKNDNHYSNGKFESFHLERDGNDIKIVSDGVQDMKAHVQSQAKNAGLVNILKFQEIRYGSIQNAIARNEIKKVYADVSKIPDTIGEQAEMVSKANAEIDKLCSELGLTKDQILSLTPEKYLAIKQAQANAQAAAGNEGGNE